MNRGDVWTVVLPLAPGGREQSGQRPAVILQDEVYGQNSPLVLIVPLTSQLAALRFPGTAQIEPSAENGLTLASIAMVFQTRALDRSRFITRLCKLSETELAAVITALNRLTGQP